MAVDAEEIVTPQTITLNNVHNELVRYLTTAVNYVRRQRLSNTEITKVVEDALPTKGFGELLVAGDTVTINTTFKVTPDGVVLPVPKLLDKGINDMRVNRDA